MSKKVKVILSLVISTLILGVAYYVALPPLNAYSVEFWISLIFAIAVYGIPLTVILGSSTVKRGHFELKFHPVMWVLLAIPAVVIVIGSIFSSTFFNAQKYASIAQVEEAVFSEDMPEVDTVTNISLMDTTSAQVFGERKLGELSDVVSQYQLSYDYNQINFKRTPKKISNLEYADFFKWLGNRENGIPGYVMVDPVSTSADYIQLDKPLKYVDSGYLGDDLMRKLRFSYPTKIFDTVNFEVDDEGNPYFIVSCLAPRVFMFGGMDVHEVIVFNPCDGTSTLYDVGDAPAWIDNVFSGYLACEKYDWKGTLSGGFWNSVIGNKDCKITTDDFGYIVLEDDVWYFTGVTSVTSDESNIGFIISNARTGEYKYYTVAGAEEYSAMGAAQGEVQEKGYTASFPSLINVSGKATYIMMLKDANDIPKLYALVNVENYTIVATGETQTEAKRAYVKLLEEKGVISEEETPEDQIKNASVLVEDVRLAVIGGETVVYITDENGAVYKGYLEKDESLILIRKGDIIDIKYIEAEGAIIEIDTFLGIQE
ncbi:MAG: hypothetical protein IJX74_00390 [Clostridia bacterium]|nr:hypothetical protein [Clostridia bacterium]